MNEIKNKKTVLNDEAAIYHHKEDVSEKEKWKNMSWKEKASYFKEYYLLRIIVTIVCIGLGCSLLHTIFSPRPENILSVAIIDSAMFPPTVETVQAEFEELIGLDSETQEVLFDSGYYFAMDGYESFQKFAMYNAVGDLDVTIMPRSVFETYAPVNYFSPVTEHLPADLYDDLSEYLVECMQKDEEGNIIPNSETVYGICLDSTWPYEKEQREESIILSINIASSNTETVEKFLRFLFFRDTVK